MGFAPSKLWTNPEVNPINRKARSIPILNVINIYGRVFFFSWLGFFIAFWSWYAFPPLHVEIAKDLKMTTNQVANSNIVALLATLLVRLVAGPACDRFGPRYTFAGCLLIGAIPTFLIGTSYSYGQLMASRFFIGILGGSFVPCQVWTTGFFDKNIIGTANSLTGGFGNSGGGVTYFVMPAIYVSLMKRGESLHTAWRVAFVVPGILIVSVAVLLVVLCPDTPSGKWADRQQSAENNLRQHGIEGRVVDIPGQVTEMDKKSSTESPDGLSNEEKKLGETRGTFGDNEVQLGEQQMLDTVRGEVVQKPTFKTMMGTILSPQTFVVASCYFCSFGAELAINSILGAYFTANFKKDGVSAIKAGDWAAMFGLMNVVWRPLGGFVSDLVYRKAGTVWAKKIIMHVYLTIMACFLLAIGFTNPKHVSSMVGLVCVGLAFFLEGANGMNYSLVPHVHPHANGVVSGFTGACGNLGGIIFAIIFRYQYTDYAKAIWIWGFVVLGIQVLTCWIPPIPKGQIGGR